jgi:predicted ArsR family transcriptional regulator
MRTIKVSVKAKVGKLEKTKEFDYDEPSDFAEAIEMDGEREAFKTFLNERKTNFQDKMRKKMVDDITKKVMDKLKELDIEI